MPVALAWSSAVPHIVQLPRLFLSSESLCLALSARQDVALCSLALPRLACTLWQV